MNSFHNRISDKCSEVSVKKDYAKSAVYSYPLIPLVYWGNLSLLLLQYMLKGKEQLHIFVTAP